MTHNITPQQLKIDVTRTKTPDDKKDGVDVPETYYNDIINQINVIISKINKINTSSERDHFF